MIVHNHSAVIDSDHWITVTNGTWLINDLKCNKMYWKITSSEHFIKCFIKKKLLVYKCFVPIKHCFGDNKSQNKILFQFYDRSILNGGIKRAQMPRHINHLSLSPFFSLDHAQFKKKNPINQRPTLSEHQII